MLRIHERTKPEYEKWLGTLSRRGDADLARVEQDVRAILEAVQSTGDEAVRSFTERFDGRRQEQVRIPTEEWTARARDVDPATRGALTEAAERIRRYHERQRESGFRYEQGGIELGQLIRPMRAAGVYAPGGKARYPSTVLMSAIPAAVAGVPRIVLATPEPTVELLAAAELAGVTEVVDAGGAQAIGALAYGTDSVDAVDVIVGPGNIYVACAKRLVFGTVNIDQIAGPSEILVIADQSADPEIVAADLLSQAEHDEDAYPLLVCLTRPFAETVASAISAQLASLPRKIMTAASVKRNGHAFVCGDLDEAIRVANVLAAEHLSLAVQNPEPLLERITAAGAVFVGHDTPEAAGDYAAGPSHVLPTGGAARFGSPLGVYNFIVRSSLIRYSRDALNAQGDLLEHLARIEGFEAHARAVAIRRVKRS